MEMTLSLLFWLERKHCVPRTGRGLPASEGVTVRAGGPVCERGSMAQRAVHVEVRAGKEVLRISAGSGLTSPSEVSFGDDAGEKGGMDGLGCNWRGGESLRTRGGCHPPSRCSVVVDMDCKGVAFQRNLNLDV